MYALRYVTGMASADAQLVRDALARLGIDHLALVIHDASFPSEADEETGRGSPYGRGALAFMQFTRELGFNALQLGPQGRTSPVNRSPYDGTIFARDELSLALSPLVGESLLSEQTLRAISASAPGDRRVDDAYASDAVRRALDEVSARAPSELRSEVERNTRDWAHWLEADSLYLALSREHATGDWRKWPELDRTLLWSQGSASLERRAVLHSRYPGLFAREAMVQTLLDRQHRQRRSELHAMGLSVYGDLQIGISFADEWAYSGLFLRGYRMGAPPSRTNPDGQPWSYPVLDPELYGDGDTDGAARRFVRARMRRMLGDFDGLRLDHPHGWVDPWVYRTDVAEPELAVRTGARLFASPDLPDHPALSHYAIARLDQLDRSQSRHSDGWVRELDDAQVERYGRLLAVILEEAKGGLILPEVLSTWPYPLRRVMQRLGLGRFLVTQKTDPNNPGDMYRSESARASDWMMLGTHDTESVWSLVPRWMGTPYAVDRARHLAERLEPNPALRARRAQEIASSPDAMIEALFAELFAGEARAVSVFFADLLGMAERYNAPGTVGEENWTLRVPRAFRRDYSERVASRRALSVPRALAMALHAKGSDGELRSAVERMR